MKTRHIGAFAIVMTTAGAAHASADVINEWNAITVSCTQGPEAPANRPGPPGLLDIALVHAAMHDAVQAIEGRFEPYAFSDAEACGTGSPEAAAAAAAHAVLVGLYGADDPCLAGAPDPEVTYGQDAGLALGRRAAAALLEQYRPTVTLPTDPFLGGDEPGQWRPTPGVAAGAFTFLAETTPFVMRSPAQFRPKPPPPLESKAYARDYDEVKLLGALTSPARTPEQTELARFWTANWFSQWNAALRQIAEQSSLGVGDAARLFALVAFVAADSQISVYDAKYHYNYWRPITAIHEGDRDGNPRTEGDPTWTPFVATPPYPDYSSGANCLVASITTLLRLYFGTDEVPFSVSSSAPGSSQNPRYYDRLSDAEREVVEVRILQGIHFRTAEEVGRRQGARIARWAFERFLTPYGHTHGR